VSGVSGGREFAAVVRHAAADIVPAVEKVVFKGAMNIKSEMQSALRGSAHFKGVAPSVTFDIEGLSAEIGPERGAGSGAPLAHFAYWGGANGGGGTVEDPEEALKREAPVFTKHVLAEAVKSFD
jgi:hypothetical protein